jgi:hypothetical protein
MEWYGIEVLLVYVIIIYKILRILEKIKAFKYCSVRVYWFSLAADTYIISLECSSVLVLGLRYNT